MEVLSEDPATPFLLKKKKKKSRPLTAVQPAPVF